MSGRRNIFADLFSLKWGLTAAIIVALGSVGLWLVAENDSAEKPARYSVEGIPPLIAGNVPPVEQVDEVEGPLTEAPQVAPIVKSGVPSATPKPQSEYSVAELIEKIRNCGRTEERLELVEDLSGRNTAEAVKAIHFVFLTEKHPKVKAAMLAGLGDMDAGLAPDTRLQLLTTALRGEAREVRSTALDLLAENESPAATALLSQTMKTDPDREIRDVATEYYRQRKNSSE
jgi:hypothetical protein